MAIFIVNLKTYGNTSVNLTSILVGRNVCMYYYISHKKYFHSPYNYGLKSLINKPEVYKTSTFSTMAAPKSEHKAISK